MRDLYGILGVGPGDTVEQIRSAYRRLARQLHPDMSGDPADHRRFADVADAYRVLSDPHARRSYDARRLLRLAPPIDRLMSVVEDPVTRARVVSRIAQGLHRLSQHARQSGAIEGRDLLLPWDVTFAESYTGTSIEFSYPQPIRCGDCKGTGFKTHERCSICAGAGSLPLSSIPGLNKRCPRCGGRGIAGEGRCEGCRGKGLVRETKQTTVLVPAGVSNGARLRVKGKGAQGRFGGRDGDLLIRVNVDGSLVYARDGQNLVVEKDVDLETALFGGVVQVVMPDDLELDIPVSGDLFPGQRLGVTGRGFPSPCGGGRGDLIVVIDVRPPEELTPDERRVVTEWLHEARSGRGQAAPALTEAVRRAIRKET